MTLMAREERISAAGWCWEPERDHGHGAARIAVLRPGFIASVVEMVDLLMGAHYGADAAAAAEARWRAAKVSQGLAQIGSAYSQPQPAHAPPPVFSLAEPVAPTPTVWRPAGYGHLNH